MIEAAMIEATMTAGIAVSCLDGIFGQCLRTVRFGAVRICFQPPNIFR